MEKLTIEIPAPDFSFIALAKRKAKNINETLHAGTLVSHYEGAEKYCRDLVTDMLYNFNSQEERLTFLSAILTHVILIKVQYLTPLTEEKAQKSSYTNRVRTEAIEAFEDYQHFLYNLITAECNYKFDKDLFSDDEVVSLNNKLDNIQSTLDTLLKGEYILGEEIELLKEEIESLRNATVQGKKSFKQRILGVISSYIATKGADEAFDAIKPDLMHLMGDGLGTLTKLLEPPI